MRRDHGRAAPDVLAQLRHEKRTQARGLRKHAQPAEAALWPLVRRKRLGVKFRRQAVVSAYICDFYVPALMLIIELDGEAHTAQDTRARARRKWDEARDAQLRHEGYAVVRLPNDLVLLNPQEAERAIRAIIETRREQMATPTPKGTAR